MRRVTGNPWFADFRCWTFPELTQRSWFLVLTKRRAASGYESAPILVPRAFVSFCHVDFKTSSTGNENWFTASQLLFFVLLKPLICIREMYSECHFLCLDVFIQFFIKFFENTNGSLCLLRRDIRIKWSTINGNHGTVKVDVLHNSQNLKWKK